MGNNNIKVLSPDDWPKRLKEIPQVPEQMFIRGNLPPEDCLWISIVGSRKFSAYGEFMCQKIISELAGYPIVIVSGLAYGIDSIAHKCAINYGLTACVVPGSGLDDDSIYPRKHLNLAHEILESGGCMLSEYEKDFKATNWSFPMRNRIMVGLSHAVILIEAAEKSGSMITARMTSDYNRDLFVVPGRVGDSGSEGPLKLLKIGAIPITGGEDIINEYCLKELDKPNLSTESQSTDPKFLTEREYYVYKLIESAGENVARNELLIKSKFGQSETNSILTMLEIYGLIKIKAERIFILN